MDTLERIVVWLNGIANAVGGVVLAPVAVLPGWLSATLIAILTGLLMLVVFKYTSNQSAIKKVRQDIKANLLALKLFKDSPATIFKSQGGLLLGAFWLLVYALIPMLVMLIPVTLILFQIGMWYEVRPLAVGEDTLLLVKLSGKADDPLTEVQLQPNSATEVIFGPARTPKLREVRYMIKAREAGQHRLVFQVAGQQVEKDLAIGDGFMHVSMQRPGWFWTDWFPDPVMHPLEPTFAADSPIQSITIDYPKRSSYTSGSGWWVLYWFAVSLVAAFVFRPLFNVKM